MVFFSGARVTRCLVLCVKFVGRCFFFCTSSWPLCCLSFDLRIPITPLVSSSSSYVLVRSICTLFVIYKELNCIWFVKNCSK